MDEEQNSNKIICDRSELHCNEDTDLSKESLNGTHSKSKTTLTRKLRAKRRSNDERADYTQQIIDELNGDDLYARAKMAEDILEGVLPTESRRPRRPSQDKQLYDLSGNSGSENGNSQTHSFRKFVGREKNKRLEALKRIAADAKKLKRNTEETQSKMDGDRWNRMCGDFTQFAGATLPIYPTFSQPSYSGEFEHIDDGFGSLNIHSAQRKYPHDLNRRRFLVDRMSIGDPFADQSAPEYTDTEFDAYGNAYDSEEYDLPSTPTRKSSRTAKRDVFPDGLSCGDQVDDFDTFFIYGDFNLPSGNRDAMYDAPYDDEFDAENRGSLRKTPYLLEKDVLRTQTFEDNFAENANAHGFSDIELLGTHQMRNPTKTSFRKPKVSSNKEKSMWQRLLEDELLSQEEKRPANTYWDEINHEYDARRRRMNSRHIVEDIFDSIINDVRGSEWHRNSKSDGSRNSEADAAESDSSGNLGLPSRRFKKHFKNSSRKWAANILCAIFLTKKTFSSYCSNAWEHGDTYSPQVFLVIFRHKFWECDATRSRKIQMKLSLSSSIDSLKKSQMPMNAFPSSHNIQEENIFIENE